MSIIFNINTYYVKKSKIRIKLNFQIVTYKIAHKRIHLKLKLKLRDQLQTNRL